ncbi:MAG TPA: hypothetical protein VJ793_12915 [Anaerolineae bacterium]|nr:hypothetical protein [Anaerolineae bacterium]
MTETSTSVVKSLPTAGVPEVTPVSVIAAYVLGDWALAARGNAVTINAARIRTVSKRRVNM